MTTTHRPYLVTGRSDTNIIAPRLSIEELQLKDEQFTLFILSFLKIQDRGGSIGAGFVQLPIPPGTGVAAATFYNIAAIHGKPYARWPGDHKDYQTDFDEKDPKDTEPVPSRFGGYCNHGSVLFPTWHRPYVLLIEQAIGEQATALALAFDKLEEEPDSTKWQEAAKELRFPYWDWASPKIEKEGMPSILYEEQVSLKVPQSAVKFEVDNPLSLFPFAKIPGDFTDEVDDENVKAYFTAWKTTLRHPRSDRHAEHSRIDELQKDLKTRARDLRSKVAALFTFGEGEDPARVWDEFSNNSPVTVSKASQAYRGSLEGVHDSVHDIIGGLGHMGFPDYAGFDPIFYLHHANVDRLYSLWEYCYQSESDGNGYWMGSGYKVPTRSGTKIVPWTQPQGTYSAVYNGQLLPDSALAPFRMTNGEYWSSKEARLLSKDATPKYYTYDTLGIKVDEDASKDQRLEARRIVQEYYKYKPQSKDTPGGLFKKVHIQLPENLEVVEGHRQFVVVVDLLEHAYNGPYSFKLYKKGASGPEVVGGVSVFARPDHSPCAACAGHRANGSTIKGAIFLDEKIIDDQIFSAGDETIVPASASANIVATGTASVSANVEATGTTDVANRIKSLLAAELVKAGGIQLGVTHPLEEVSYYAGVSATSTAHLSKDTAPVSVTLLSTAAVRRNDIDGSPINWADWRHHGDVFDGGHRAWKKPGKA